MIFNYRKYGSVNRLRTFILYSFVLYLLSVYFLVILPLPNPKHIHSGYKEMINIVPFTFVRDFIRKNPFVLYNPKTWIKSLKRPTFYVPVFNIAMLIPFGIYLRYYFKCNFKKTILFTLFLSLFFEMTQLSGLYFIYPGPYRLADIDDIIQNTIGGGLGYFIGWFAVRLLPSREEIDEKAMQDGLRVSQIRVCLSLMIDMLIMYIPYILLKTKIPFFVFTALYFSLIPLFNGKTIGSALLKFGIVFENLKWFRTVLRGLFLTVYFLMIPSGLLYLTNEFNKSAESLLFLIMFAITFLIYILFGLITILTVVFNKCLLFDVLSGTVYKSTVRR